MKKLILLISVFILSLTIVGCSQVSKTSPGGKDSTPQVTPAGDASDTVTDSGSSTGDKKVTVNLYFADHANEAVLAEKHEITVKDGAILKAAIEALLKGPDSKDLRNTIPEGTKLNSVNLKDKVAIVDFSETFPRVGGVMAEAVELISVVNTLTDINGVEKVKILVNGKDLIAPSDQPYGELSRYKLDARGRLAAGGVTRTLTLYFGNANADALVPEKRTVTVNEGVSWESVIVNELMAGANTKGLSAQIPEDTRLLSATTKDGLCTLDFSKEFVDNNQGGTARESIIINSIVNSLTELPTVQKVQFLVEGKVREVYTHAEFDRPFTRNEAMTIKSN